MEKKIVFFDIDGTLIDNKRGITNPTEKTKAIIKKIIDKKHIPVIATGRPLCIVHQNIIDAGFDSFVSSAGAHIRINGEIIYDAIINEKTLKNAFEQAKNNGVILYAEGQDYCYTIPEYKEIVYNFLVNNCKLPEEKLIITSDFSESKANKMFCMWKDLNSFTIFEKAIKKDFYCTIMHDNTKNDNGEYSTTDIMPNNLSKAIGVKKVLELLNIDKSNSYAVGDGLNDLEMFDAVNISIAMGNGADKLKEKATIITESIDNEGLYNAFIKMDWLND